MARRRPTCPGRRRLTSVDATSPDRLPVDRAAISEDLEAARSRLHALLGQADAADLRRRTNGTGWTNEQLLFHMVFGFLIVRVLVRLVRVVGRPPAPVGLGPCLPARAARSQESGSGPTKEAAAASDGRATGSSGQAGRRKSVTSPSVLNPAAT